MIEKSKQRYFFAASKSKTVIDEITFAESTGDTIERMEGTSKKINSKNKSTGLMPASA